MDRIQLRRDTSANWTKYNPILMEGEVGYETDTKKRKIGDGTNTWNNLDYLAAENISQELGDSEIVTISQKVITEKFNNFTSVNFNNPGFANKQGIIQQSDNWFNSGYIPLSSISEIDAKVPYMSLVSTLALYDENKSYIGEIDVRTGTAVDTDTYKITITSENFIEDAKYIIVTINTVWAGGYYCYVYNKPYIIHSELSKIDSDITQVSDKIGVMTTLDSSEKDYILFDFTYTENRAITSNGFKTNINYAGTADIDVIPGEEYRLHTYTYGGDYQYAFYNNSTLVSVHNLGTTSTYVEWNEDIVIPNGVNKLYVTCVNNNLYKNLIYKRQIIDSHARASINLIDELGYFEECAYTPILGKVVNNGCLDNITDNEDYGYVLMDVEAGEIYHVQTGTTIAALYAYAFYKGPYFIDKFLGGQTGSVPREAIFQIPEGVDKLLVCFAKVYLNYNRFSIKKKAYKTIEQTKEQIYPELKSGYIDSNGSFVDNSDYSYAEVSGGGSFRYKGGIYGGSLHNAGYIIDDVYYGISIGTASSYKSLDEIVNIPSNATKTIFNFSNTYLTQYGSAKIERIVPISSDTKLLNLRDKKYACLGDSITADDYCHIGTMIGNLLETDIIGNFAVGGATCADAVNGSDIDLTHTNNSQIGDSDVNVLSNQVRRLIANSTPNGEQITWTHPIDGQFNIDTSYGTGKGNTEDIPDIIYIAIGINDGGSRTGAVTDDTDTVFEQTYSNLTRKSIASALRWAIETLQSAYPSATIFVATPLWTASQYNYANTSTVLLKREIIMKTAGFCGVRVIDSTYESGYTKMAANYGSDEAKIHPDMQWRYNIAKYVANEINNRYIATNTTIFNGLIK